MLRTVLGGKQAVVISDASTGKGLSLTGFAVSLKIAAVQWLSDRYLVDHERDSTVCPSTLSPTAMLDWIQGRIFDTTSGTARQFPFLMDGLGRNDASHQCDNRSAKSFVTCKTMTT